MKDAVRIETPLADETCRLLKAGDKVFLSGEVYTGRDMAHRRLCDAARKGEKLPIPLQGTTIFYAAPTPASPGRIIGSVGPTTSYRMDSCTLELLKRGLKGMIGKGRRSPEVVEAIRECRAVYFGAPGGVAALLSRHVKKAQVVAYEDLGPEAILKLEVSDMPLVVLIDSHGRDLYGSVFGIEKNA